VYSWAGPLVALGVIGVLALVLRWTYGSGDRFPVPRPDAPGEDYGLLRPVTVVDSADAARALRAVLSDSDIRATSSPVGDGTFRVMVFAADLERARRVVGPGAV
jgi:hypothetical protein